MSVASVHVMLTLLTATGIVLAVLGILSLRDLLRSPFAQTIKSIDPFSRTIAVFTTGASDADFRRAQRQTIWLFCGAMLVLYLAR